eukprot:TRINITY_DN50414_c0_g1_i15.p1 TRINITY_DN50414_c0_g1~~TRINITY_DN50414_c0_g1_i15.p1  ORF type:complete len:617 (-),score=21.26 TRINITY_DN50414_c0_g1_i15:475-2325(-)
MSILLKPLPWLNLATLTNSFTLNSKTNPYTQRMSIFDSNACLNGSEALAVQGGYIYTIQAGNDVCSDEDGCWLGIANFYLRGALMVDVRVGISHDSYPHRNRDQYCSYTKPFDQAQNLVSNGDVIESFIESCRETEFRVIGNLSDLANGSSQVFAVYQQCATTDCALGPYLELCLKKCLNGYNTTIICIGESQAGRSYDGWLWNLPFVRQENSGEFEEVEYFLTIANNNPTYDLQTSIQMKNQHSGPIPVLPIPDMPDSANCPEGVSGYSYPSTESYRKPLQIGRSYSISIHSCSRDFLVLEAPQGDGHIEDITIIARVTFSSSAHRCNLQHIQVCLMKPYATIDDRIIKCASPQATGLFGLNEVKLQTGFLRSLQIKWIALYNFNTDCPALVTVSQAGLFQGFLGMSPLVGFIVRVSVVTFIALSFALLMIACIWARAIRQFRHKVRLMRDNEQLMGESSRYESGKFFHSPYICFRNWMLCSAGLCVPNVLSAMNTAELQNRDCHIMDYFCASGRVAEYITRQRLLHAKRLQRQPYKDSILSCCCYSCIVMQHHEELNEQYKQFRKGQGSFSNIQDLQRGLLSGNDVIGDNDQEQVVHNTRITRREHFPVSREQL